jgi:hypothetical protein
MAHSITKRRHSVDAKRVLRTPRQLPLNPEEDRTDYEKLSSMEILL